MSLTHYHTIPTFDNHEKEAFRKHCGNQHFLLLHNVFYPSENKFSVTFILSSANALNLDQSKILSFVKELRKEKFKNNLYDMT